MVPFTGGLAEVAHLIQLAVAPIFLLTAVATTLMVFTQRLARIVDRGRSIEHRETTDAAARDAELRVLEERAHWIYRALCLGVIAALCVSFLMTAVFAGAVLSLKVAKPSATLFLLALFSYTAALCCLMREVFLAVGSFKLGLHAPQR
jgi:hypothetical protein